jgi:NAD(P)-dependent dehydrogenase (short-subunit alcohol dehydrogenase family)
LSDPTARFSGMELEGKISVITGGGSGLGRHLALGLAEAGAGVVVADLDPEAAGETAELVRALGKPAAAVVGDVRDPAFAQSLIDEGRRQGRPPAGHAATSLDRSGGPHILINNAGGWTVGDQQYPRAPAAAWSATLDLNLRAPMLLSQLALGPMSELGDGVIINIASSAALGADGYGSPEYAATKAALIRFTTAMAGLEQTHGVRMMCLVPGWIGLERAHREVAALPPESRPTLVPPEAIVAAAIGLIERGRSGAVVEMLEGKP